MNVVVYGATGNSGSEIVKELVASRAQGDGCGAAGGEAEGPAGSDGEDGRSFERGRDCGDHQGRRCGGFGISASGGQHGRAGGCDEAADRGGEEGWWTRLVVVGGAGQLEVAPGVTLIKSGYFPAEYMPIAYSHEKAAQVLKGSEINWTYMLRRRTSFRASGRASTGGDEGTGDGCEGREQDLVCGLCDCLVDEIEKPEHERVVLGWVLRSSYVKRGGQLSCPFFFAGRGFRSVRRGGSRRASW